MRARRRRAKDVRRPLADGLAPLARRRRSHGNVVEAAQRLTTASDRLGSLPHRPGWGETRDEATISDRERCNLSLAKLTSTEDTYSLKAVRACSLDTRRRALRGGTYEIDGCPRRLRDRTGSRRSRIRRHASVFPGDRSASTAPHRHEHVEVTAAAPSKTTTRAAAAAIVPAPAFTSTDLSAVPTENWLTNGGDVSNARYSSLSQINTSNVANLRHGTSTWTARGRRPSTRPREPRSSTRRHVPADG